jgi:hypothetical protein
VIVSAKRDRQTIPTTNTKKFFPFRGPPLKKISDASRASHRRAETYFVVRWSETIERNETDESFSAAGLVGAADHV